MQVLVSDNLSFLLDQFHENRWLLHANVFVISCMFLGFCWIRVDSVKKWDRENPISKNNYQLKKNKE